LCGASQAADIAPYFQSWGPGTLTAAQKNGLSGATLAFGITRGSCALDATLTNMLPDARNFVSLGGKLIVSMGGADGIYAEVSCTDDQLLALLDKLITDSGTRRIDWDIEGTQLSNVDATARRNRVLVRLQAKYPDLYVWRAALPGQVRQPGLYPQRQHLLLECL
jgi:chitinase